MPAPRDPNGAVSDEYLRSGNTTMLIIDRAGKIASYKQKFCGEQDFWKMLSITDFRRDR